MKIHGRLDPVTGRLTEVTYRYPQYPDDVELAEMPTVEPPWGYDPATKTAVQVASDQLPIEERAARRRIDLVRAAVIVKASTRFAGLTVIQRARINQLIDNAADEILDLFS
jgi:hypothetical protein